MLKTMHLFEHLCPLEWRESTLHRSVYLCLWSALELSEPQISVVKWCSRCARTWRCACDAPEGWGEASGCCWSWCWCSGATGSEGGCGSAGVWTGCSCRWAARWSRPDRSLWVPAALWCGSRWWTWEGSGAAEGRDPGRDGCSLGTGACCPVLKPGGRFGTANEWPEKEKRSLIKLTFATALFFLGERNVLFLSARTQSYSTDQTWVNIFRMLQKIQ